MPEPIGRDNEQTRRHLLEWIEREHPEQGAIAVHLHGGPSDTGFSSDTLMFALEHEGDARPQKRELVLRLEPTGGFGIFPEYDVAQQFGMMRALADTPVPVPEVLWLEEDPSALGAPFYVMTRVEGRVPSDTPPYHSAGWIHDASPEERRRLWHSGLRAMAEVHKLDPDAPRFAFLPKPPAEADPLAAQLDYWHGYMDWGMERARHPLLERALAWLLEHAPDDRRRGLCWGDSRISNQIYRDFEVAAVIDWEMVFVGDPVADLAWYIVLDRCFTEGIGIPRLEGMPGRDDTIAAWEAQVGRPAHHMHYYEVFAAFRFSAIMVRVFQQMKHYGRIPEEATADVDNLATSTLEKLLAEAE